MDIKYIFLCLIVTLGNIAQMAIFANLAIFFNHWWLILPGLLFMEPYPTISRDEEE